MDPKVKRRMSLLDDALDALMRSRCMFGMCDGPTAPIRDMKTCARCRVLHRAIQMGLIKPALRKKACTCTVHGESLPCSECEGLNRLLEQRVIP